MIAVSQIDRLQDVDIHRVLDHATRVARSELDIGDNRVAAVAWIEFARGTATQLFVCADRAKACTLERWRLHGSDVDPRNARIGCGCCRKQRDWDK